MAPIIEVLKGKKFEWNDQAEKAFKVINEKLTSAPTLALPAFSNVFKVECDAFRVGIGAMLTHKGRPIAFFSEKWSKDQRKFSTYDKEFYPIIRALEHWRHYLIGGEFIFCLDHKALKFIQGQHKLNPKHAMCVKYL